MDKTILKDYDFLKPVRIAAAGIILIIVFLWLPPRQALNSPGFDTLLDILGFLLCIKGSFIRFFSWGANAQCTHLRTNGPYQLVRHPLYLGNFLISLGIIIVINNLIFYVIALIALVIFFLFLSRYEEEDMVKRQGQEYENYLKQVKSRFFPDIFNLKNAINTGKNFDWEFGFIKSYKAFLISLTIPFLLDAAETLLWQGLAKSRNKITAELVLILIFIIAIHLILRKIRKRSRA